MHVLFVESFGIGRFDAFIAYQLLDPGPYFLGWEYHTLSCPMTPIRQLPSSENTLSTAQRGAEKRETLLRMRRCGQAVVM